jgi:hypothetical protein
MKKVFKVHGNIVYVAGCAPKSAADSETCKQNEVLSTIGLICAKCSKASNSSVLLMVYIL